MAVVWRPAAPDLKNSRMLMPVCVVSKPSISVSLGAYFIACDATCATCIEGNPTSCLSCPANNYLYGTSCVPSCPANLVAEEGLCKGSRGENENLCAPGTYNDVTGSMSSSSCKTCPPGKYCAGYKATAVTGNCAPGYYCSSSAQFAKNIDDLLGIGSSNPTGGRCRVGYYCPEGSNAEVICPEGKYC